MIDAGFGNKKFSIEQRRYLGSKFKLLNFIESVLEKEKVKYTSFADIFSGTGVVASHFYSKSNIIVNDILESNYQCYLAYFSKIKIRENFLINLVHKFNDLENEVIKDNYFSKNFSNTYFDYNNSKKIGFIRDEIEKLFIDGKINSRERAYLVTSLVYALDRIANTVGHYDAYRKVDINRKFLELRPLSLIDSQYTVEIYKKDANELVKNIYADVVYIDPPYNSRQYSDSYHLLENVASWEKTKVYGIARKIDRSHIKSRYSLKSAGNAFSDLVNSLDTKYILVSYNDMGTNGDPRSQSRLSDHELISALERRGDVTIYDKSFKQYNAGSSKKNDLKERIFFCRVKKKYSTRPSISASKNNTHFPLYIKSPLNYTGGKHKLLPQLNRYFPKNIETFFDIFCGGANVGINANAKKIVCIDKNEHVIRVLKLMQKTNFEELNQNLMNAIEKFDLTQSYVNGYGKYNAFSSTGLGKVNKFGYEKLRAEYNNDHTVLKDLLLLLLIFYSFNNQIRFNSQGKFNLPVGKRDYNGNSRKNLSNFNAITNIKNISFHNKDFRNLASFPFSKNDFLYLDPPYLLGLATYNESGGWTSKDEIDLYEFLEIVNGKGIRFGLSNVLEHKGKKNILLSGFIKKLNLNINKIDHNYKNSSYQSKAGISETKEVFITNF